MESAVETEFSLEDFSRLSLGWNLAARDKSRINTEGLRASYNWGASVR